MSKPIAIVCLLISLISLTLAMTVWLRADAIADAAVARREHALVEKLKPKMARIMADFNEVDSLKNVTTLDELFAPLFRISTEVNK